MDEEASCASAREGESMSGLPGRPRGGPSDDQPDEEGGLANEWEPDPDDDRSYEREWGDRFDLDDFEEAWLPGMGPPDCDEARGPAPT